MFGFRKQPSPPPTLHFRLGAQTPETMAIAAACFEAVARSVRLREAEAARAALARRAVGVDHDAVPMIPLRDWMVGR